VKEETRIGQIGIAHTHATKLVAPEARPVLERMNATLVGIHEPDPKMLAERGGGDVWDGVRWIDDPEAIFGDESISIIFIETWPWDCVDWARRAIDAGKHVHLDKPPGTSVEALRELYERTAEKNLCIQMGYQWRYNPGLEMIQGWVADGLLGRVNFARFRAGSTPEYYHRNHVYKYSGGIMIEENCHLFDQVAWMFGKAASIHPYMRQVARGFEEMPEGTDLGVVVFEYPQQGAMAVIEGTSLETDPGPHRRVEVHGLEGSVILEPIEPPHIELCLREPKPPYRAGWQSIEVEDRPRYIGDLEELIDVARGERKPRFSPAHDLIVHEMLIEACGGMR
jgi:predicted dehydrogenase